MSKMDTTTYSTLPIPGTLLAARPRIIADIGHTYAAFIYVDDTSFHDKEQVSKDTRELLNLRCLRIPRQFLSQDKLREVLLAKPGDSAASDDTIKLTGIKCKEYRHIFEEFSNKLIFHNKLDCAVNAFVTGVKHREVSDILYEIPKRGIELAFQHIRGWAKLREEFSKRLDKSRVSDYSKVPAMPTLPEKIVLPCILVFMSATTVFIKVSEDGTYDILDTDSSGEAMFGGLGQLMTHSTGIEQLLKMAFSSDGKTVNMLGCDLTDSALDGDAYSKFPDDQVIFAFGKAYLNDPETLKAGDMAFSLMDGLTKAIPHMALLLAQAFNIAHVFFAGHLVDDEEFRSRLMVVLFTRTAFAPEHMKIGYHFVRDGGFYGALGALLAPNDGQLE